MKESVMSEHWWDCIHEGHGSEGCPLCDKTLDSGSLEYLLKARSEIGRLNYVIDLLRKQISNEASIGRRQIEKDTNFF